MKQYDYPIRATLLAPLFGTVVGFTGMAIVATALTSWVPNIGNVSTILIMAFGFFCVPMAMTIVMYEKLRPPPVPDKYTRCGNCGYILKGLREPRCPECGQTI